MSDRLVQVNIRIAENSALRLKQLAESSGLKLGPFVERMIAAYSDDSSLLQNDSNAVQWQSVIEELRGLIADHGTRLHRIEGAILSGLTEGSGKVRITLQPAENGPVETVETVDDASFHHADSLSPLPQGRADFERQLDEKIIALKNNGMGIKRIMAELKIGQNRVYKGLKAAGLVE